MSNTTEIKQHYTLGELPELVKRLITESKFVTSPDCVIRFTAVPTEDWTKQERRAVNTALCLAVGQLPQAHGYFDGTLLESQFDQSDVLIKATTMTSGDEHTVYITITTNRCKDLIADMTLSWLTCFVKLHEHSCQGNSKPTQEKETIMPKETSAETPITNALSEITRLLDDRYIGEAVRVLTKPLNCDDVEIRPGSVEFVFFNEIVSRMRSKNVQYSFSQYDTPCFVAHGTIFVTYGSTTDENYTKQPIRDGMVRVVVGVTSPNGDEILLDAYVDPVNNTGFKLTPTQTPEKKEETMTENTEYVKNDNALAEILSKINEIEVTTPLTILLKPLDSKGNQITLTHPTNMLVGQILGGSRMERKMDRISVQAYRTPEVLTEHIYVFIGRSHENFQTEGTHTDITNTHVPVKITVESGSVQPPVIIFDGFVDPVSGVGYRKTTHSGETAVLDSRAQLTAKLREVANYAKQVSIMMFANVSIPKLQFFLSENAGGVGMMHKTESTWDIQVNLVNELMTLANKLGANAAVNISSTIQGNPAVSRTRSFGVMNNSDGYIQPNMYPSATNQQPPFSPNFFNGFHPHNPCQPGYTGGVGTPFAPQGGPTVQGFKSQPNS